MRLWPFFTRAIPAIVALSACSAPASNAPLPTAPVAAHPAARMVSRGSMPSQLLFVPDSFGSVYIYPLKDSQKYGPVGVISNLPGMQYQSTVDAKGNFLITNQSVGIFTTLSNFYIGKYAPPYTGAPTQLQTEWKGNIFPAMGVATDQKGTVYASSCGAYCQGIYATLHGVLEYKPGATKPSRFVQVNGYDSMGALTSDAAGDVYGIAWNKENALSDVFEIPAGATSAHLLKLHGFNSNGGSGGGIALDTKGDLYVTNPSLAASYVLEFKKGANEPFRQYDVGTWIEILAYPMDLIVGPDGNVYVPVGCGVGNASEQCPLVYGFHPGKEKPFEALGVQGQTHVAIGVAAYPNALLQGGK